MEQFLIDQLMHAALREGRAAGVPITVSVVDDGGHLRAMVRQEGCSYFALESSRKKAVTSSQLKLPTHVLAEIAQKMPSLQATFSANTEVWLLPGGFPIRHEGQVAGGLGVAGGDFVQDRTVAEKAVQAVDGEETQ